MTGHFEWLESNVVQWVPDQYWPANSTVKLAVGGKRTQFVTGPKVLGVASLSKHTFTVTIDGDPAGPPVRLPAPHHLPHAGEEGVLLASMGREKYPTPVGKYTVLEKNRTVLMDSSSVGVPITETEGYLQEVDHAVRITWRGIFVHSAPWAVPSMGLENTSHGCIGLIPAAAEWYYDTVKVGDPVIVEE
jgi:lipoprotein-anchoring transpeptidase ErfK/SrfK